MGVLNLKTSIIDFLNPNFSFLYKKANSFYKLKYITVILYLISMLVYEYYAKFFFK